MRELFALLLVGAGLVQACVSPRPFWTPSSAPSPTELARYQQTGTGTIRGQAFLRQSGGGVVTCAGAQVALVPDIAYTRDALEAIRAGFQIPDGEAAARLGNARRVSQCDAQGGFVFAGLPPGDYIAVTRVSWNVGYYPQGGVVVARATLKKGQNANILATEVLR